MKSILLRLRVPQGSPRPILQRIVLLELTILIGAVMGVIFAQWVLMRWAHARWGEGIHYEVEIFLYGVVGPLLVFAVINRFVPKWWSEKARAEESLAAIVNSSSDAIVSLNQEGQVLSWNRGAELIFGYRPTEMIRHSMYALVPPDQEEQWEALGASGQSGARRGELELQTRDGRRVPVELARTPLHDERGQIIGSSLIIRDITERKRHEQLVADERVRIARDLHDGVQQDLFLLGLKVDLCRQLLSRDPDRVNRELGQIRTTLSEEMKELQRLVRALRPIDVERLGFLAAVRRLVMRFAEQHQIQMHFNVCGAERPLSEALESTLFRILQEALANVAKHAQAQNVWVELDLQSALQLELSVRDDGRGFEVEAVRRSGLGLKHMQERLAQWGGQVAVESAPSQGTTVSVSAPLPQPAEQPQP